MKRLLKKAVLAVAVAVGVFVVSFVAATAIGTLILKYTYPKGE